VAHHDKQAEEAPLGDPQETKITKKWDDMFRMSRSQYESSSAA